VKSIYGWLFFFFLGMGAQQLALMANQYQRQHDPKILNRGDKVELVNLKESERQQYQGCEFWYIDGQATNSGNMVFLGYKCGDIIESGAIRSEFIRKVLE
jgi:hypothetical protein